ncbi:DUF4365 domain-containing protein [Vibrio parahaemolyticus]|uniref:DUF4365 domain-containing protein n=1 Tax=Vibrio parahaemolyticus TaxID=670 RepID=UPI001869A02B|nr:DUF4365 domain-containing protein [Vibrio parahaemolyticus]EGR1756167.1 DUF4365 domain-containing protein [Vibrio parahaemolyticus]ELB2092062.1 DUF4365 domain-containing protein [Vibrio parahaemolyticus]ELB2124053.1 DUF4365 domain-containing protein [Vibrio parahaemolyticus]MBE4307631.1 DUF4365 domain-containing protein [Vibrio parahaemolyticus]MDF5662961.1 DUF4365 domain-containing protein [Vibrio parahaemolyticus]
MRLPKRTRAHILEELSVDKFKSLLPHEWVYRIPTHDYGIDGEVEVFDNDGLSTGIKFLVQLKATDEKNSTKALKLRMSIEKLNYFKQLDCPVLVVRYLAHSDTIYSRWFHSLNPTTDTLAEKSFCMQFSSSDEWNEYSTGLFFEGLKAYNNFKSKTLQKPIKINASIKSYKGLSTHSTLVASSLINSTKENENTFTFEFKPTKSSPSILEIDENDYYINLGGVGSVRGSFDNLSNTTDALTLVADINVTIGLLLQSLGHTKEAEVHFDNYIQASKIKNQGLTLISYTQCKIATRAPSDALLLIESIVNTTNILEHDLINEIQVCLSLITSFSNKADVESVIKTYKCIDRSIPSDHKELKATLHYNLGNFLSARSELSKAIHQYNKAAKMNPDYKKRAYWLKEVAGLLFCASKYTIASKFYTAATDIEDTAENAVLLADSLIFCGRFEEASDLLDTYIPKLKVRNSIWCLKSWTLDLLVNDLGIKKQQIGKVATTKFIENANEDEIIAYIVKTNAICPECWYSLAQKFVNAQDYNRACISYLLLAFSDERYRNTWMNALQCAYNIEDLIAFSHLIEVIGNKFGSEAIGEFFSNFPVDTNDDFHEKLSDAALQAIQHCEDYNNEQKDNTYEIRFGDSKSMNTIALKRH